jgi:CMP-N,N'-diacetyllegionaminic acid synthase
MPNNFALIPARSGSKRIKNKNLLEIAGHPLIAYAISSAKHSGIFTQIVVSTDSSEVKVIAESYGALVPQLRPEELSRDLSPDLGWVELAINNWLSAADADFYSILRPTNPLRMPETIRTAFDLISNDQMADSLRAVRPIKEHPSKAWRIKGSILEPLDARVNLSTGTHNHSSPLQTLEKLYIQDASLEFQKVASLRKFKSIAGEKVIPFTMPGFEGFDINYQEDVEYLKYLVQNKRVSLPRI